MQVTIEGIEQFVRLDGKGEVVNSIRIRLQDGTIFTAKVEAGIIERILALSEGKEEAVGNDPEPASNGLAEDGVFGGELIAEAPAEGEQLIDWMSLPETHLPAAMKRELELLSLPPIMRASELVGVIDQVTERMLARAQKPAAPAGPVPLQNAGRRTVPKDELGYPMVPSQPSDPGEVALIGDEDGVAQL